MLLRMQQEMLQYTKMGDQRYPMQGNMNHGSVTTLGVGSTVTCSSITLVKKQKKMRIINHNKH